MYLSLHKIADRPVPARSPPPFPRAIQPQNENGGDLDVASSVWSAKEREKDRKRIDFFRRHFAIRQVQEAGCRRGGEERRVDNCNALRSVAHVHVACRGLSTRGRSRVVKP